MPDLRTNASYREEPEECQLIIEEFWPELFEAMRLAWVTNPGVWPEWRTIARLHEGFDLESFGTLEGVYQDEAIEYR